VWWAGWGEWPRRRYERLIVILSEAKGPALSLPKGSLRLLRDPSLRSGLFLQLLLDRIQHPSPNPRPRILPVPHQRRERLGIPL